jgi:hypothetical protein
LVFVLGALAFAVVAFMVSLYETRRASQLAEETQRQLDRANQALAESINNDLALQGDKSLTARQRNALWKLAAADEPVKRDFVSILAKSPDENVRASPGFAQISRALGLLRPSGAEAESLVAAVLGGLPSNQSENAALVKEFEAWSLNLLRRKSPRRSSSYSSRSAERLIPARSQRPP